MDDFNTTEGGSRMSDLMKIGLEGTHSPEGYLFQQGEPHY